MILADTCRSLSNDANKKALKGLIKRTEKNLRYHASKGNHEYYLTKPSLPKSSLDEFEDYFSKQGFTVTDGIFYIIFSW